MARVIHFEIHAADPERAARFYEAVFGWKLSHIAALDYWTIATGEGPGIDGGMLRRRGPAPSEGQAVNAFVCTIGVEDVDATIVAGRQAGGILAMARFTIPGVGHTGYLKDTEGNIFGLHQADPSAGAAA